MMLRHLGWSFFVNLETLQASDFFLKYNLLLNKLSTFVGDTIFGFVEVHISPLITHMVYVDHIGR